MPDYFLALNKQYGLATNDSQAQMHAKSVVQAWYLTLPTSKQKQLTSVLPEYLVPKQRLLFHRASANYNSTINQSEVMIARIFTELQKTDEAEVLTVIKGLFKSLKVVLDHQQKFELSKLLDKRMLAIFIKA